MLQFGPGSDYHYGWCNKRTVPITLSREYAAAGAPDIAYFQASGILLKAVHDWSFLLGPKFHAWHQYDDVQLYIFFKSKLVPRFIPVLGMIGATLVFIPALFEMFGVIQQVSVWGAILSLPVASNEMILAVCLIFKGFNESALASMCTKKKAFGSST